MQHDPYVGSGVGGSCGGLAVDQDVAGCCFFQTYAAFDEGAFSGSIVAEEGGDGAGLDGEVDSAKYGGRAVRLVDVVELK